MHAFAAEDVDGSGERRGDRGHEHGEATVLQLLDDEGRDESFFDFGERRLPDILPALPGELLRQTTKERVARKLLEERLLPWAARG
jgi:hypothetical protein